MQTPLASRGNEIELVPFNSANPGLRTQLYLVDKTDLNKIRMEVNLQRFANVQHVGSTPLLVMVPSFVAFPLRPKQSHGQREDNAWLPR
jgi:hypothetical protein